MKDVLAVALGGALGSTGRYILATKVGLGTMWALPVGTILVNILGCFAIGIVNGIALEREWLSPTTTLFLTAGFLGGFTTYSAFGYEAVQLAMQHSHWRSLLYVGAHVLVGIPAAWFGFYLSRL